MTRFKIMSWILGVETDLRGEALLVSPRLCVGSASEGGIFLTP